MAKNPKEMTDEEILVNWIRQEKQYDLLDGVQRIRHQRVEKHGLRRGLLFVEDGVVYPDPSALQD